MSTSATYELREAFTKTGFVGPLPVFDRAECARIRKQLHETSSATEWSKGKAAASRLYYAVGTHPRILDRVTSVLGDDVMLWGTSLLHRKPGQVHPWHTDIETSGNTGCTVTVWIGLKNTNLHSSLQLISFSHQFGITLQERAKKAGKRRGEVSREDVVQWAREHDPRSAVEQFDMSDGEALFFDGRLWHGSHNTNEKSVRTALILQYATPDTPIRIPDTTTLEWPFQFVEEPRPPCIMVQGTTSHTVNKMVPPPPIENIAGPTLSSWLKALQLPLEQDEERGWKPHPIFRGPTRCMKDLSCHVSVLNPGITPHPPHQHKEEELLIMLSGEAELVIGDPKPADTLRTHKVQPGSFVYYPARQLHTIHNAGVAPATYLMFKWAGDKAAHEQPPLQTAIFQVGEAQAEPGRERQNGFVTTRIFEGPTQYLRKLHCHVSTLSPGGGYPPHVDAYDVAILVLSGTVETLGKRVGPHGVIFYSAGEPHGMKNVGETPATYLVFEFHGSHSGSSPSMKQQLLWLLPRPIRRIATKSLSYLRR